MAKERKLMNSHGLFLCTLSKQEAISLQDQGLIKRIGKASYRMIAPPDPSKSRDTPCHITQGDMIALAGMHFSESQATRTQRERLFGYGLIPAV